MKAISLKLEDRQLHLLEQVSRATHVPKSALVRRGIDLVLQRNKSLLPGQLSLLEEMGANELNTEPSSLDQ